MEKIFHVFVSSTYVDLIDERKRVSEAVAKAGYVAEGMEIFPASSQKQMDFIERVIDRCDYYILILAGKYGSLSDDGQSYTEKEFHYAKSKGIPILTFMRKDIEELPSKYVEKVNAVQGKLETFKNTLKSDSIVDFWDKPDELAMKALAALSQARVSHQGVGWIRADRAAGEDILNEINDLRKTNYDLQTKLSSQKPSPIFDDLNLADLDEKFEFRVTTHRPGYAASDKRFFSLSWRVILASIGFKYRTPSNTNGLRSGLSRAIRDVNILPSDMTFQIEMADQERILMQMEALGMMDANTLKLKRGGSAIFHKLSAKGLATMLRENAVKASKPSD